LIDESDTDTDAPPQAADRLQTLAKLRQQGCYDVDKSGLAVEQRWDGSKRLASLNVVLLESLSGAPRCPNRRSSGCTVCSKPVECEDTMKVIMTLHLS
jgi:hypothetical protein